MDAAAPASPPSLPVAQHAPWRGIQMGSQRAGAGAPGPAAPPPPAQGHAEHRHFSGLGLAALPPEAVAAPGELVALHAHGNRLREAPPASADLAAQLTRLEELHLGWNELSAAPAFALPALLVLSLPRNRLSALPPDLPALLPRLRALDLSRNRLAALPPTIARWTALELLDLAGNQLAALPPAIGALQALQVLQARCNRLAALPAEVGALGQLRLLNVRCNELTLLPAELGLLTSLRSLCARSNLITHLPPAVGALTALRELDLFDNRLSLLPLHLCKLTGLASLQLQENPLDPGLAELAAMGTFALLFFLRKHYDLQVGALAGTHYQNFPPKCRFNESVHRRLDLSASHLAALPEGLADALYLQQLDASLNRIADLTGSVLLGLSSLTVLSLRGNQLAALPPEFTRLAHLSELHLSFNLLSSLAPLHDAHTWRHVTLLDVAYNGLAQLPPHFGERLPQLRHLDLSHNGLAALPPELGARCSQLEHLAVAYNRLDALPASLAQLAPTLLHLDAAHNELRGELRLDLRHFVRLRHADLRSNRLAALLSDGRDPPPAPRLAALSLCFNRLSALPPSLAHFACLQSLAVSNCQLAALPALAGLHALTAADFSYNRIAALPRSVGALSLLVELNLAGNQLVSLPAELAALAPTLRVLHLRGNPLAPPLLTRQDRLAELLAFLRAAPDDALAALELPAEPLAPPPPDLPASLAEWTAPQVGAWLRAVGFGAYCERFAAHCVDGPVLAELADEHLTAYLGLCPRHLDRMRSLLDALKHAHALPAAPEGSSAQAGQAAARVQLLSRVPSGQLASASAPVPGSPHRCAGEPGAGSAAQQSTAARVEAERDADHRLIRLLAVSPPAARQRRTSQQEPP